MPWSTPPPPIYWKEAKIQDRLVSTWHVKILLVPYNKNLMKISKIFSKNPPNIEFIPKKNLLTSKIWFLSPGT